MLQQFKIIDDRKSRVKSRPTNSYQCEENRMKPLRSSMLTQTVSKNVLAHNGAACSAMITRMKVLEWRSAKIIA